MNTHNFGVADCWSHQLNLAVSDAIGPRRQEMMSQQIKETPTYSKTEAQSAIEASLYRTEH